MTDRPRIALVGNMNNGHFSLLRHLIDLGIDAELLMYANEAEHFRPQHDTWEWQRWAPHVRQLPFENGGRNALAASRRQLERELGGYDAYVGNGIAPVLFRRMHRVLDLFVPYAEGVEFIIEHHFRWTHPMSSGYSLVRKWLMEAALASSVRVIASANQHPHSQDTYRRLGLRTINLPIVPLYAERRPATQGLPDQVQAAIRRFARHSLVVFSHVSHIWKHLPVPHFMGGVGKRNNWLVEGFERYVRRSGDRDALLVLVEYGRDVAATQALVRERGLSDQVLWLPQMSRRELMCVLPHVDIGGSEFAGMYWGGCGWEFLASGVPMLHQLEDPDSFATPDRPLPPFFNVQGPEDIERVLLTHTREALRQVGARCRQWFDRYQGQVLAREYLAVLGVSVPRPARAAMQVGWTD